MSRSLEDTLHIHDALEIICMVHHNCKILRDKLWLKQSSTFEDFFADVRDTGMLFKDQLLSYVGITEHITAHYL